MRKSARTQIPPFFDNDPYTSSSEALSVYTGSPECLRAVFVIRTIFIIFS